MINVLVADDHAVIRQGLKRILAESDRDASHREITVSGEASSVQELRSELKRRSHDAVVLDLSMPGGSGLEALKEIKNEHPQLPVLILSIHPEDQYAVRALKAGASGYLSKECAPEQLVTAIQQITRGERYVTAKVADLLANQIQGEERTQPLHTILSDREFQVLVMIGQGKALTEIAKIFSLSVKTISTYRNRILKKMKMKNNAEIIHYVIQANLLNAAA